MSAKSIKKRKPKRKLLREGPMAELYREMDRVYNGALEVIKRHPVTTVAESTEVASSTPYRKAKSQRQTAAANPEIAEYAKANSTLKTTALIRAVATAFPEASVAEIRASLPNLNPSTVGIQVGKARHK